MRKSARTAAGATSAPDPVSLLDQLGAVWSPDFDAYASGSIPISQVRCVLCRHAPCTCTYCPAVHENAWYLINGRPQYGPCGMRVDPAAGECPRGHAAEAGPR